MTLRKTSILTVLVMASMMAAYADITGKWMAEFDTPVGVQKYTFDFKADGSTLHGTAISPRGAQEIKEGKINGDEVSFVETLNIQDQAVRVEYKGKLNGDEIKLTRKVGDFGQTEATAKRSK